MKGIKPEIIVDIGSCWNDTADLLIAVSLAKAVGADVIKYQYYTHEDLYGVPGPEGYKGGIPEHILPQLAEKAEACKIELMVTAFSERGVDIVDPYVKRHKIAASEASWLPFVQYVALKGKPVIATVGHMNRSSQQMTIKALLDLSINPTFLYGEPEYPCDGYNLNCLRSLSESIPSCVGKVGKAWRIGLSDHSTTKWSVAVEAAMWGADVIEKHVQFAQGDFPDSCVALKGAGELLAFVQSVKYGSEVIHGDRTAYVTRYNRRLIASKDIAMGARFEECENYGGYRSLVDDTQAFSANICINSYSAARDIKAGEPIGPSMIGTHVAAEDLF